jgi:outer membrane protein assembly factor BamB
MGLGALAAAGCRHQPPPRADNAPHGPIVSLPAGSFTRQWSASLDLPATENLQRLWLRRDLVLARTDQNDAYQFDASSGTLQAVLKLAPPTGSVGKPVLTDHFLVWPANSIINVFDFSGRRVNSDSLDHAVSSGGAAHGDRFFIAIHYETNSRLLALDLADKYIDTAWELQRSHAIISAPAVYENTLYTADSAGSVFAVATDNTRNPAWPGDHTFHTYAPVLADLKVDDYGLYVASTDTILYCLDRNNAKVKWQWLSGQALRAAPVVTADSVYQILPANQLAAIDKISKDPEAYNRKPRWIVSARQFLSADAKNVYVLGTDGHLLAVDKQTGQIRFQSVRSDFTAAAINPASATIYAATPGGLITAITPVLQAGSMGERQ